MTFYFGGAPVATRTQPLQANANDQLDWRQSNPDNDSIWSLVRLTEVPEPASLCLLGLGGLALLRRRR